jgi:ADP-ribose pyrophosphatase YjhB (NUDIX family)
VAEFGPRVREIPEGDDRARLTCPECGFIAYENPKLVAGSVVSVEDRILLCRRAIDPRKGFWTLPAGYLELNETPEEGARREAWEEARARIAINALLGVYSVPRISQVQLIYRATLAEPGFAAGPESLEVALFGWDDIPWGQLAFPSVRWALDEYRAQLGRAVFAPAVNPPGMTGDRF